MRRAKRIFLCLTIICVILSHANAEVGFLSEGESDLDRILASYDKKEIALSDQLQVIQNNVNFRKAPGGDVLGRLRCGTVLECLEETQYKGQLWYHARSSELGEGYVLCSFAKPVWNNLDYWPSFDSGNVISDKESSLRWTFLVEEDEDLIEVPNTYDSSHIIRYFIILTVSLLGIIIILLQQKKKA